MARHDRRPDRRQVALDDVQVGATDRTCADADIDQLHVTRVEPGHTVSDARFQDQKQSKPGTALREFRSRADIA